MSYINKPGKTRSWRKMITRQQVSDVLSFGSIVTTHTKAKETQRHVEKLITIAKNNTLDAKRRAEAILIKTNKHSKADLIKKLFDEIAPKYLERPGGYTRVLKMGNRIGDNTEQAVIQLVESK